MVMKDELIEQGQGQERPELITYMTGRLYQRQYPMCQRHRFPQFLHHECEAPPRLVRSQDIAAAFFHVDPRPPAPDPPVPLPQDPSQLHEEEEKQDDQPDLEIIVPVPNPNPVKVEDVAEVSLRQYQQSLPRRE